MNVEKKRLLLMKLNYMVESMDWDSQDLEELGLGSAPEGEEDSFDPLYEIRTAILEIMEGLS